jgi:predicted Fe-Mo cluster-binding NifX family protein
VKLVVTSQEANMNSKVDPRFGRAKFLLLIDTETGEFAAHDNTQNLNAVQGAGIQTAQNVVSLGAAAIITGNVGPKAFAALQAGNVQPYIAATGLVSDAMEQFKAGRLQRADEASVENHWM